MKWRTEENSKPYWTTIWPFSRRGLVRPLWGSISFGFSFLRWFSSFNFASIRSSLICSCSKEDVIFVRLFCTYPKHSNIMRNRNKPTSLHKFLLYRSQGVNLSNSMRTNMIKMKTNIERLCIETLTLLTKKVWKVLMNEEIKNGWNKATFTSLKVGHWLRYTVTETQTFVVVHLMYSTCVKLLCDTSLLPVYANVIMVIHYQGRRKWGGAGAD